MLNLFPNGTRVKWLSKKKTVEQGVIVDFLEASKNPHLKQDSYLVFMNFNGMAMTVNAYLNNLEKA